MTIKDFANNTSSNLVDKQGVDKVVAFDPIIIMVIIEVVMMLIENLKDCGKSPDEVQHIIKSGDMNWMQRFLFRRYVERAVRGSKLSSAKAQASIMETAKPLSLDDIKALMMEV